MNKKGDISIGIIITAAIALIVLIVVVAIFAGYFSGYTTKIDESGSIKDCVTLGGSWSPNVCNTTTQTRLYIVSDADTNPNQYCCKIKSTN